MLATENRAVMNEERKMADSSPMAEQLCHTMLQSWKWTTEQ